MEHKDYYYLGKITRTHGLAGSVVLKLDTDRPEDYEKIDGVFVEINGLLVPFFAEKQQWTKDSSKIIKFKNITLQMAEQAVGKNVFMPLASLPPLSGKQFYYHEVIGFELVGEDGSSFGVIGSVNDQTAQHYFITDREGREIIIPIIKDWILDVDRDSKKIKMTLPDGLLDVFTSPSTNDEV